MTTPPQGVIGHLSANGLIGITWGGAGFGIIFTSARIMIRIKYMKRLLADDYFMLLALILLIANAILQTLQTPHLYYFVFHPTGPDVEYHVLHYLYYEFTIIGIFWSVLWSVKASFLALFWMISNGLPVYRRAWWCTVVFTSLAYIGCWIGSVWTCHPPSSYFKIGQCGKPIDREGSTISISYSTAVDIFTDLLIMSLPLRILWVAKINFKQKLGLALVFCLGFAIIAAAIIRAIEITGKTFSDQAALAVWGIVESSISVVVGSLPPFRAIISTSSSAVHSPYGSSGISPTSYDRNTSARGKHPAAAIEWNDIPSPDLHYTGNNSVDYEMYAQNVQITGGNEVRNSRNLRPSVSEEKLRRDIKMVQEFSVMSSS